MSSTPKEKLSSIKKWIGAVRARGTVGGLHLRADLHLARKIWHMCMGTTIVSIYASGMTRGNGVLILGIVLTFSLTMETVRLRFPSVNKKVLKFWGPLMRTSEAHQFSGVPYFLSAAVLAIGIFPKYVALVSLMYLSVGDPIASLFGIQFGDKSIRFKNGKSLIGTSAAVTACFLVTLVLLSGLSLSFSSLLVISLIGGLVGGTVELLPLEVDDNFSIPRGFWVCTLVFVHLIWYLISLETPQCNFL